MNSRRSPVSTATRSPLFIVGPTAVGKSDVTLALAKALDGEIISVDSMQVYRGLDIGTAKPTPEERRSVTHHLIDVAPLTESFDAARFVSLAQAAVADINSRNRTAIFCGGTGLYLKAYLDGLGDAPPSDPELRAELEASPLNALLRELESADPETFAKIDRNNPRRVVRAIEVIRLTGKPFSAQRSRWPGTVRTGKPAPRVFAFTRTAADLHARIDARVDAMFARGLVDETRSLLRCGLAGNKTAMQAIGYRQVVEHLDGERDLTATIELVKVRTRQFAKRQLTWFRRQLPCEWIQLSERADAERTAKDILTSLTSSDAA